MPKLSYNGLQWIPGQGYRLKLLVESGVQANQIPVQVPAVGASPDSILALLAKSESALLTG